MKVLVCGGRNYRDIDRVFFELDKIHFVEGKTITLLIHGNANGADRLAGHWAVARGVEIASFSADWNAHGRAAGPIRNRKMLEEGKPELVIAFPGGEGTRNMLSIAKKAGIETIEIDKVIIAGPEQK
jgi:hypothetical protein